MTTEKKYLFILGAMDPEMRYIERLLDVALMPHVQATKNGRPVEPGNAYDANDWPSKDLLLSVDGMVLVECGGPVMMAGPLVQGKPALTVDHHQPGDPGYGKPPEQFYEASSVGQVMRMLTGLGAFTLGERPPELTDAALAMMEREIRLVAASDHCLRAAYAGNCPGVDPAALLEWRQAQKVAHNGGTVEELEGQVQRATWHLMDPGHPRIVMDGELVVDLRAVGTVPELPEAGVRAGIAYLVELAGKPGERKVVLQASDGRAVHAFLHGWAEAHGYARLYGDPARGMCGGYRVAGV